MSKIFLELTNKILDSTSLEPGLLLAVRKSMREFLLAARAIDNNEIVPLPGIPAARNGNALESFETKDSATVVSMVKNWADLPYRGTTTIPQAMPFVSSAVLFSSSDDVFSRRLLGTTFNVVDQMLNNPIGFDDEAVSHMFRYALCYESQATLRQYFGLTLKTLHNILEPDIPTRPFDILTVNIPGPPKFNPILPVAHFASPLANDLFRNGDDMKNYLKPSQVWRFLRTMGALHTDRDTIQLQLPIRNKAFGSGSSGLTSRSESRSSIVMPLGFSGSSALDLHGQSGLISRNASPDYILAGNILDIGSVPTPRRTHVNIDIPSLLLELSLSSLCMGDGPRYPITGFEAILERLS